MRTTFAWVLSACMACFSVSCLTTSKIDFDVQENVPPAISSAPSALHPLSEIAQVNISDELPPGATPEFVLEVSIFDVNIDQTLSYRLFRDGPLSIGVETPLLADVIPAEGDIERSLTLAIPFLQLGDPGVCHKFDLIVTGGFANLVELRRPAIEGDLDIATWWVEVTSDMEPAITERCQ